MDWNNKEFVLEVVKQDGEALQYASDELRNDKDVVLAAVQQDRDALQYASDELKDDEEVVLAAIEFYGGGMCLEYASERLKNDKDLVLADLDKLQAQQKNSINQPKAEVKSRRKV